MFGHWKMNPRTKFVLNALLWTAIGFVVASIIGCQSLGVAEPKVRSASYDVVDALTMISDHSDEPETAGLFAALAIERAAQYDDPEVAKHLTDLDKIKVKQLQEGLQSLYDRRDDEPYVTLRAFTLRQLAASIGLYNHDGLKKTKELIDEITNKPEEGTDGNVNRSEADPGEAEGTADGLGTESEGGEGVSDSE